MNAQLEEDQINFSETEIKKEEVKPLEMRLVSKINLIRKSAYEEISSKGLIEKYEDNINTFLSDSSPGPLESALELLHNFIKQKRPSDDKASCWAKIIIEKSFSCSQMQCLDLAKSILCNLLAMNYDPIIKLIKSNLSSPSGKNTKKIMQYEIILQHLIAEFGRNIRFEEIDIIIKGLTAASNPGIRNLANRLAKDIYSWDKDNVIANQLLKEKEKEAINYNRNDHSPNRQIVMVNNTNINVNDNGKPRTEPNLSKAKSNDTINNNDTPSSSQLSDSLLTCDYYLSTTFMDKLSAKHQKANEKKKQLEELTNFLTQSPQYIQTGPFLHQFQTLFEILKNFLNENNTNVITSVIRLLSHLSRQFSHNEHYTSFLLDILPKLLDKFNLSNDGINDEVHAFLNDIVIFNISFDHFLVFIENISVDDNINYTINILTFALNQIKANDSFNMKSFPNQIIDVFQRLSIDDNELISNLAFNVIELLNIREHSESMKKEEVIKHEVKQPQPQQQQEEETKIDTNNNNQSKGKTFRTIKKKKENLNKNQIDKDANSNSNAINSNINNEVKTNEVLNIKKPLLKSIENEDKSIDIKSTSVAEAEAEEEKKEESPTPPIKKSSIIIPKENALNNDECLVGGKSSFNQMLLEEMKQANEEREKTDIPMMIEKDIKPLLNYKKKTKESTSSSQAVFPSHLIKNDDLPSSPIKSDGQIAPQDDYQFPKETKEQALLSFEKKMELALQKEEEEPTSRKQSMNDATDNSNKNNNGKQSKDESQFEEIKAILGEEITKNMDGFKWEAKKQAFEDISTFIQSNSLPSGVGAEEKLFAYLKFKLKDFKETNFNINREAISLFIILISTKGLVFNSQAHLAILNAYYGKLCDSKLKEQTNQLLTALLDIVGVSVIITSLVSKLQKKPNVNLLKEYAAFFSKCVEEYEINQLPIKELVDLCKAMASNVNPQVRAASISLLCSLYKYIGNDIKVLIKDIKESSLKIIEAEFEKVTLVGPETPRELKGKGIRINFGEGKEQIQNKSKELIPRRDISKKITSKMIKDIRDGKWPEKKEACEEIEKLLLEANMKILPDGLGELFNLIKSKLSDGNKNIVRMIISLLSKLIEATGLGFKSFAKQIALALLPNFADKMQLLREECHLCLEKWVEFTGFETFSCFIPQFVRTDNVELRIDLLKVIMKNKDLITKQIGEPLFKEMVGPLLLCLQDKASLVRSAAEEMIVFSFQFINLNNYYNGLKDFKPAIENDLRLVLGKLKDDDGGSLMTKHESSSTLISTIINTSMRTQAPVTNHASTPSCGNNATRKDINEKKIITTPISEQKKVQSIRVYKKTNQHQLSSEDIKAPVNKTLSTTPTHSNKDSLTNISINPNSSLNTNSSLIKSPNMNKISAIFHNKKSSVSKYQVFLLNVNVKPNKEKRIEFDRKFKFTLETLSSDSENKLRDQVKGLFTEEFIRKLFNEDFKQVVNSLQSLSLGIQKDENSAYLLDNLDIILKSIGYKCNLNQNPLMVKALLDFFEILYLKVSTNVILNDTEANIIVCLLVDKLGVSNSTLKDHLQTLIDNYFLLITPSKAMAIALKFSLGKNIKIKAEILEILTLMHINQSIDIINRQFARMLSRFLSVNDNNVKGKTIALFKEIYSKIHEELWNIIDINDKERECLEANLYDYQRDEEDEYIVSESDDNYGDEADGDDKVIKNDFEYHNSSESSGDNAKQQYLNTNANAKVNLIQNQPLTTFTSNYITNFNNDSQQQNQNPGGVTQVGGTTISSNALLGRNSSIRDQNELLSILKNLLSEDIQERVNTIIIIHEFICAKYDDNKEILVQNVDNIVTSFIEAMNILFANKMVYDIPVKFTKYLATVLCKIATNKELISHISYDVLFKLSEEILSNYLIENLDKIGDNKEGSIIFRSLNSTMLRLLDNCNSSHIILCLLELVRNYREDATQIKLAGLAIQCLIKLNESIDRIIEAIEVDKVFLHFHLILCDMEKLQSDLQMKSQTDQMILRYIKNFINDIVKHKKEDVINDYIKGVKSHLVADKYILKWIKNVLSSLNIYPTIPSNSNSSQGVNPISKSNTSLPTQSLASFNKGLLPLAINNNNSSSNVIQVQTQTQVQTQAQDYSQAQGLNETSKNIIVDKKANGLKKGESIIEDLKSRMLKQQNLTRSNKNFNYSNINASDMNNTITELKKKWNDVNKKTKAKK